MTERRNERRFVSVILTVMIIFLTASLSSCGLLRGPHKMAGPSIYPVANYEEGQWIVSLMDETADENQPFDNLEHIFKRLETEDVPDRVIEAHELEKQIGN